MAEENKENASGTVAAPDAGSDKNSAYHRRRRAFLNASDLDMSAKKAATKVFREFVLNEEIGALIWRSARVAHEAAGLKREDFELSLENSDQMKPDHWIYHKAHNRKKDPYKQLLLQEWIKYLYYGGSRRKRKIVGKNAKGEPIWEVLKDEQGKALRADDQDLVMHYFGIETHYERGKNGDIQLKCDYSWHLSPAMQLRNLLGGHSSMVRVEEQDMASLMKYYDGLMGCLEPLATTYWVEQDACRKRLEQLKLDFFSALGAVSYRVEDLMAQQEIDPAVQSEIEDLLIAAGEPVVNGRVCLWGDILDVSRLVSRAFQYYRLSKASGVEQLKAGMYAYQLTVRKDAEAGMTLEDKPVAALEKGGSADWVELAERYRLGTKGVEKDEQQAVLWYEKAVAADMSNWMAMHMLGQLQERMDPTAALVWYRKAAEGGLPQAQVQLGRHCENGTRKQTRNWSEAIQWYEAAAQEHDPDGLYHLGRCYELGRGVVQNYGLAAQYYSQAAHRGSNDAKAAFAGLQLYGRGVSIDEQGALKALQALARAGCAQAHVQLGKYDLDNPMDHWNAFKHFQQAARAGDSDGYYYLGWCCEHGRGTVPNKGEARQWYMRAAQQGHCEAQVKRAFWVKQGLRWMEELAEQNYAPAQVKLARWCLAGEKGFTAKNVWTGMEEIPQWAIDKGISLLQAAKDRSDEAKWRLARCYLEGCGVPQNEEKGYALARQVAERATGKDRMMAEGLVADTYWRDDDQRWLSWADRAARSGHVRWAIKLVQYYCAVEWKSDRVWNPAGYYLNKSYWVAGVHYDLEKVLKYLTLAAEYGNSSMAWALADLYKHGSAYVPGQKCSGGVNMHIYSDGSRVDPEKAWYWYDVKAKREQAEANTKGGFREWDYLRE